MIIQTSNLNSEWLTKYQKTTTIIKKSHSSSCLKSWGERFRSTMRSTAKKKCVLLKFVASRLSLGKKRKMTFSISTSHNTSNFSELQVNSIELELDLEADRHIGLWTWPLLEWNWRKSKSRLLHDCRWPHFGSTSNNQFRYFKDKSVNSPQSKVGGED